MPRPALPLLLIAPLALLAAPAGAARAEARDHVIVVGSSTVYPFATTVAESFGRGGRFKTPVVESTGTGGGFKLFCSGVGIDTPDVNDASRPMTDSEQAGCVSHGVGKVVELRIGFDGIVIASSKRAQPFDLSREQLYRAVARTVVVGGRLVPNPYRRWSEVDAHLPNRPIVVFGPAPNHGTRDAFVDLVMAPACGKLAEIRALAAEARERACRAVREDGGWIDVSGDYAVLLGKLTNDPTAAGVFTFSYLDQNRDKLQAARIDGVAPELASIASGAYPVSRPLFIYVKQAHVAAVPGLAEFVQEFLSDRAAGAEGYLADKGLTPLPRAALEAERAKARALAPPRR
ncbi:MAG TPA: substrate-binding domain-containing protein [Steroidobacteraceae bacterium]|nr:substrate-binding domain-containing protein [Steroidobacteraceae bacterium]